MADLHNGETPDSSAIDGAGAEPAAEQTYDAIAEMQAAARSRFAPGFGARPPKERPRFNRRLLLVIVLAASLVAGGALVAYGVTQFRQVQTRHAAEQAAKQREIDRIQAEQQAQQQAEQSQAATATQTAVIDEGKLVSAQIATLTAMNAELGQIMDSLNRKATSSASAARRWSRLWSARQAAYRSRYAAARAHNARERSRYSAGIVERANSAGKLVIRYTYSPRYLSYPARPKKPAGLRVSVASERTRLANLSSSVETLRVSLASHAATAQPFGPVYPVMKDTGQVLRTTVADASSMARRLVVTSAQGQLIKVSRIKGVKLALLDAPFAELNRSFSAALTAAGLTPDQVVSSSGTQ